MGNPITKKLETGTFGELLVQLRLLEYGVQATPPIKDSGNDLIAIKGRVVKFIQVKTSKHRIPTGRKFPKVWDIACLVKLKIDSMSNRLLLDKSKIIIFEKDKNEKSELSQELVNKIWKSSLS